MTPPPHTPLWKKSNQKQIFSLDGFPNLAVVMVVVVMLVVRTGGGEEELTFQNSEVLPNLFKLGRHLGCDPAACLRGLARYGHHMLATAFKKV